MDKQPSQSSRRSERLSTKRKATDEVATSPQGRRTPKKPRTSPKKSQTEKLITIREVLSDAKLFEILPTLMKVALVTIDVRSSIDEAYKVLHTAKILSAPLYNTLTGECEAVLDVLDIVEATLKILSKVKASSLVDEESTALDNAEMLITQLGAKSITDLSHRNKYVGISVSSTLLEAAELLCERDVHRVIVEEDGVTTDSTERKPMIGLVTQSAVIRYIFDHASEISDQLDVPLSSIPSSRKGDLVVVDESEAVLHAFRTLHAKKVSGAAVVNADGRFVENISASDLQLWTEIGLTEDSRLTFLDLSSLGRSVKDLLEKRSSLAERTPAKMLTVTNDDSLSRVVHIMATYGVHRVHVIDENSVPTRVISMIDVLRTLLHQNQQDHQQQSQQQQQHQQ